MVFHRHFSAIAWSEAWEIPMGIPNRFFLAPPENSSVKNALHLSVRDFAEIFGGADVALLWQGKDNKSIRLQKVC